MRCPTCNAPLESESLAEREASRCAVCSGIWLRQSDLGDVLRQTEPVFAARPSAEMFRGDIHCPKCGRPLVEFNYAHDSGILINKCDSCRGIWLEADQLGLLAGYRNGTPATRRLEAALAEDFRTANKWRVAKRLLRSRLLSGCIAVGYILVALLQTESLEAVFRLTLFLVLPIACIWFSDALGNLTGIAMGLGRPTITDRTPGDIVAVGGWLLLLCPMLVMLIARP